MPGDATEGTRPMAERARISLEAAELLGYDADTTTRRDQCVAEAQVEATLAVAEELRALRDALTTRDGWRVADVLDHLRMEAGRRG
jgi:hypothetical protein